MKLNTIMKRSILEYFNKAVVVYSGKNITNVEIKVMECVALKHNFNGNRSEIIYGES